MSSTMIELKKKLFKKLLVDGCEQFVVDLQKPYSYTAMLQDLVKEGFIREVGHTKRHKIYRCMIRIKIEQKSKVNMEQAEYQIPMNYYISNVPWMNYISFGETTDIFKEGEGEQFYGSLNDGRKIAHMLFEDALD